VQQRMWGGASGSDKSEPCTHVAGQQKSQMAKDGGPPRTTAHYTTPPWVELELKLPGAVELGRFPLPEQGVPHAACQVLTEFAHVVPGRRKALPHPAERKAPGLARANPGYCCRSE
jgi:hypothetical protein